ncbi:transcriptional repressor NF-X1-like isoform X2 [Dreissena polymorpha]|uniref:transcriptional repressor NF-X1-like isoform X2 n=1 Tax=Dreissena polymorpha TaxID=45954 RepID=UPI0022645379|nr:transcriptional repressor NF-X1-like isoform X2 [Dreissena polymorpha]
MEGSDYSAGNGYGYDGTEIYYPDPQYHQGYGYGPQGPQQYNGNWYWSQQAYVPAHFNQPVFDPYQAPPMGYEYQYGTYNNMAAVNQPVFEYAGNDASGGGRKSKYSYSQNRNRNRQKQESRQNGDSWDAPEKGPIVSKEGQAKDENQNNSASNDVPDKIPDSISEVYHSSNDSQYHDTKDKSDRRQNRGGRFQGTDTRSRYYDKDMNAFERQKAYNRNYTADSIEVQTGTKTTENVIAQTGDEVNHNPSQGTRPKERANGKPSGTLRSQGQDSSYKKGRGNGRSFDKPEGKSQSRRIQEGIENNVTKESKEADNGKDIEIMSTDDRQIYQTEGRGGRRKKKEYQIFTTSPRDWQGKNNQYSTHQDSYDRYNYRGQDYNKRHKEVNLSNLERGGDRNKRHKEVNPSNLERGGDRTKEVNPSNLERGGDRTKLSEGFDVPQGTEKSTGKESSDQDRSSRNPGNYSGQNRGSRQKIKVKIDESQRGVLIEQLTKGTYECMVCCDTVRAQNAVWSCTNCYHLFHLGCIKKWARSPNAIVTGTEKEGWRCPACQNLSFSFPNQYKCFCGKMKEPTPHRMDTPHSCGDVCQKDRGEACKHPCNILCHPGPCPECTAMVTRSCDCGKTKQTTKCSSTLAIKCEQTCERQLNCGKHFCQAKCHSGSCEKCEVVINQECFGKHESRTVSCGSEESFTESYSCQKTCDSCLDCGNHKCERPCHNGNCSSCQRLPTNLTRCPCGAETLDSLSSEPRKSCLDPIPTCGSTCNKILKCGPPEKPHRCDRACHEGECGTCSGYTTLSCRCLLKEQEFKCSEIAEKTGADHIFLCDKRCNRKKACGRHKCGLPCCVKEEHPCDLLCNKKLSCGLHRCTEPCHKTNCPPCLMASFDELTCYCGVEVMYPPIPCGTKPPECIRPCTRQHGCDHEVRHICHSEEVCPPCTELTKKMCMGNHVMLTNIACHLTDLSCGMNCNKPLPCGNHTCNRICHKGPCVEEGQTCTQPCKRKRDSCEHPCAAPCHGEQPCPNSPCKAKVLVKCACGHRETMTACFNPDSSDFQRMTMQSLKDSIQGIMGASSSVNIGKYNQSKMGLTRYLDCNEECSLVERNRRIALALEIQNPDLSSKLGNPSYSDYLKEFARKDATFVASVEKALSELVQSAHKSKQPSRSHSFPSMNMNQRRLVHELAEFYGCTTQSYDYEPKKNVVATANKDRCWLPSITLTALVQRELHPWAPPPIPHVHKEEALRINNMAAKQSTLLPGERDTASKLPEGWQVIGKKTKKISTASTAKSGIGTIDKFESNLADICSTGTIDYALLSNASKEALKSEPVVDYFDFTVN